MAQIALVKQHVGVKQHSTCRYIDGLPIAASPEAFGLHQNADITRDQNDTALMFQSLAATSGGASGGGPGGGASEGLVASLVRECLQALPPAFDLEAVQRKYPVLYEESMNTVLVQEMTRFNKLTGVIRDSLQSIDLALKVCDLCCPVCRTIVCTTEGGACGALAAKLAQCTPHTVLDASAYMLCRCHISTELQAEHTICEGSSPHFRRAGCSIWLQYQL